MKKTARQTKQLRNSEDAGEENAERDKELMKRAERSTVVERRDFRQKYRCDAVTETCHRSQCTLTHLHGIAASQQLCTLARPGLAFSKRICRSVTFVGLVFLTLSCRQGIILIVRQPE